MAILYYLFELLSTLMLSVVEDTIKISKASLIDIRTYLQNAKDKIEFLQLYKKLQLEELQQHKHHSKLVFVHNNPLFYFEIRSYQQPASHQVSQIEVDSNQVPIS